MAGIILGASKKDIWKMNHDAFLSWVADTVFTDAYRRLHEAACEATRRYHVPKKDSVVGMERYGILDFVLRLTRHMQITYDVQWRPQSAHFAINDYLCFVNRKRLIKSLRADSNHIRLLQIPHKRSKMTLSISGAWGRFEREMMARVHPDKRFMRYTLMLLYADYIGHQLQETGLHAEILAGVHEERRSFLPGVCRVLGTRNTAMLMGNAQDRVMMMYEDAAKSF